MLERSRSIKYDFFSIPDPDPEVKKAPDPASATILTEMVQKEIVHVVDPLALHHMRVFSGYSMVPYVPVLNASFHQTIKVHNILPSAGK